MTCFVEGSAEAIAARNRKRADQRSGISIDAGHAGPMSPTSLAVSASLLVLAAVLRLLASRNDLWLDEVWSLNVAHSVRLPLEIFTGQFLDNNHCLNTWLMYLLSSAGSDWLLRLPALVVSIGTVALAGLIVRQISHHALGTWVAILLTGSSYLMIHYGSEARGYALAGGFALLAWYAALRGLEHRRWVWPILFWMAVTLGVLSHATYIAQAYAGLAVWTIARLKRLQGSRRQAFGSAARWHAVPLLLMLIFYWVHLRHMEIGGGPRFTWHFVLGRLEAFTLGLPAMPAWLGLSLVIAAVLLGLGLWDLRRRGSDLWLLYAANCFVCPALLLVVRQPERLYERYFFVSTIFFLILMAQLCTAAIARRGAWRAVATALVAAGLVGNAVHTVRLIRDGRGQYAAALRYIYEHTTPVGGLIQVTSDHDFRNRVLVEHFAARLPADARIVYVSSQEVARTGAEWMILHSRDESSPRQTAIAVGGRGPYRFQRAYPSAPMSGFHWFLFKLDPEAGTQPQR